LETARIAALLDPFLDRTLPEVFLEQISTYIDLLLRWNAKVNLTAVRDEDHIVTRHFGESLFLARHLFPDTPRKAHAVDIGSGAGFPALPLKLWAPAIHLTLIESNQKKVAFLREVIRALTLTNIDVKGCRAEDLAADPAFPRADIVTFRAVEHFESILPIAERLLARSGRLALLIGSSQLPVLNSIQVQWQPPIPIPDSTSRVLSIGSK